MGMVAAVPLVLSAVGALGKMKTAQDSAATQASLLNMQATQESMAATQRMSNRVDDLNQVLGAQTADAAGRGLSLASTSLHAVSKDSFDKFAQDKQAEALGQQFRDANLRVQLQALRNSSNASIFSAVSSFGMNAFSGMRTGGSNSNSKSGGLPD